jgi:hypothetical protein
MKIKLRHIVIFVDQLLVRLVGKRGTDLEKLSSSDV